MDNALHGQLDVDISEWMNNFTKAEQRVTAFVQKTTAQLTKLNSSIASTTASLGKMSKSMSSTAKAGGAPQAHRLENSTKNVKKLQEENLRLIRHQQAELEEVLSIRKHMSAEGRSQVDFLKKDLSLAGKKKELSIDEVKHLQERVQKTKLLAENAKKAYIERRQSLDQIEKSYKKWEKHGRILNEQQRERLSHIRTQTSILKQRSHITKGQIQDLHRMQDSLQNSVSLTQKARMAASNWAAVSKKLSNTFETLARRLHRVAKVTQIAFAPFALVSAGGASSTISVNNALTESLAIMDEQTKRTEKRMASLADQMSLKSAFSARELAGTYYYLASAGLNAQQSMANLENVTQFAAAGNFELQRATELLTDAQSALGMSFEDPVRNMESMRDVSDALILATQKANATTEQFAKSLSNKAAASARAFKVPLEETMATLMVWADQGEKGLRAGTAFARMLINLTAAAEKNAAAFREHGINILDQEGGLKSMAEVVSQLENGLQGVADVKKVDVLQKLGFRKRMSKNVLQLLGMSEKIADYTAMQEERKDATKTVFEKQMTAVWKQILMLWNKFTLVARKLGEKILPKVKSAMESMGKYLDAVLESLKSDTDVKGGMISNFTKINDILFSLNPILGVFKKVFSAIMDRIKKDPAVVHDLAIAFGKLFLTLKSLEITSAVLSGLFSLSGGVLGFSTTITEAYNNLRLFIQNVEHLKKLARGGIVIGVGIAGGLAARKWMRGIIKEWEQVERISNEKRKATARRLARENFKERLKEIRKLQDKMPNLTLFSGETKLKPVRKLYGEMKKLRDIAVDAGAKASAFDKYLSDVDGRIIELARSLKGRLKTALEKTSTIMQTLANTQDRLNNSLSDMPKIVEKNGKLLVSSEMAINKAKQSVVEMKREVDNLSSSFNLLDTETTLSKGATNLKKNLGAIGDALDQNDIKVAVDKVGELRKTVKDSFLNTFEAIEDGLAETLRGYQGRGEVSKDIKSVLGKLKSALETDKEAVDEGKKPGRLMHVLNRYRDELNRFENLAGKNFSLTLSRLDQLASSPLYTKYQDLLKMVVQMMNSQRKLKKKEIEQERALNKRRENLLKDISSRKRTLELNAMSPTEQLETLRKEQKDIRTRTQGALSSGPDASDVSLKNVSNMLSMSSRISTRIMSILERTKRTEQQRKPLEAFKKGSTGAAKALFKLMHPSKDVNADILKEVKEQREIEKKQLKNLATLAKWAGSTERG